MFCEVKLLFFFQWSPSSTVGNTDYGTSYNPTSKHPNYPCQCVEKQINVFGEAAMDLEVVKKDHSELTHFCSEIIDPSADCVCSQMLKKICFFFLVSVSFILNRHTQTHTHLMISPHVPSLPRNKLLTFIQSHPSLPLNSSCLLPVCVVIRWLSLWRCSSELYHQHWPSVEPASVLWVFILHN